jgi:rsbT co-antagonist protein RsbR
MASRAKDGQSETPDRPAHTESTAGLLRELVAHLRQNRTQLREEWARRITRAQLLTAMTEAEIFAEATSVYDNYVEALETGTFEALQTYARNLSTHHPARGRDPRVVGIVLLLRDVLARSCCEVPRGFRQAGPHSRCVRALRRTGSPTPSPWGSSGAQRIIRQRAEAIRELSTPCCRCASGC